MDSAFKLSDEEDHLRRFRDEFVIPTFRQMKATAVPDSICQSTLIFIFDKSLIIHIQWMHNVRICVGTHWALCPSGLASWSRKSWTYGQRGAPNHIAIAVQETLIDIPLSASRGVEGHFDHPYGRDWMHIADKVHPLFAELVGQLPCSQH